MPKPGRIAAQHPVSPLNENLANATKSSWKTEIKLSPQCATPHENESQSQVFRDRLYVARKLENPFLNWYVLSIVKEPSEPKIRGIAESWKFQLSFRKCNIWPLALVKAIAKSYHRRATTYFVKIVTSLGIWACSIVFSIVY